MVERFVLVKLHDAHVPHREEVARECRAALEAVPVVQAARVGVPADESSARSWDLALVVTVADAATAASWQEDPAWRAFQDEVLRPRMSFIKAWNFALV